MSMRSQALNFPGTAIVSQSINLVRYSSSVNFGGIGSENRNTGIARFANEFRETSWLPGCCSKGEEGA